jgi:hypothetical protein
VRAAAGPSVYDLPRDAGGDRSVLSRFLAGKRTITLENADRLAAVLSSDSSPGGEDHRGADFTNRRAARGRPQWRGASSSG